MTLYGSHYMICMSKHSQYNSPGLAQYHSYFRSNNTWRERRRDGERQREGEKINFLQTSNSAATCEARSQTFPMEVSFCAGLQICSFDQ